MKFITVFFWDIFKIVMISCLLFSCEKQVNQPVDDFYRFARLGKLTLNKPLKTNFILGFDTDDIPLRVSAYDKDGEIIETPEEAVSFFANGIKLEAEKFEPRKAGDFKVVGKLAGQVSDTLYIRVFDPASLALRLTVIKKTDIFFADGVDTLGFHVDLLNGQEVIDTRFPIALFVNDKEFSQTFSTTTPGNYTFKAKALGLVSNEITLAAQANSSYAVVRMPVIFHEVNTTRLNPTNIKRMTDGMTKAFRNQLNLSQGPKDANGKDLFVEFYPAETGLDGNRLGTAGLHRLTSSKSSFTSSDAYSEAFNSFWDPDHYINIWVYSNITGDYASSSWAYYPLVTSPMKGFGIGVKGNAPNYPYGIFLNGSHVDINYDGGRTEEILSHEAGHLLGLYHVFDGNLNDANACSPFDPDYCSDTPYYDRKSYVNAINYNERYKRTSCAGESYLSNNFMDYFYSYSNNFTGEQLKRVRHTINYGLWLPTPYNGARAGARTGMVSMVKRPDNLQYIKPVVCTLH